MNMIELGRERADTVMSTSREAEDNSLLTSMRAPGTVATTWRCTRCLSGAIGGAAFGVVTTYTIMAHTLLLPSVIHHAVAVALFPAIGALLGVATAALCSFCRRKRRSDPRTLHGVAVVLVLLASVLLVTPSNTQADLWTGAAVLLGNLFDAGPPSLPQDYCAAAAANAAAATQDAGSIWWHQWGATPSAAASRLVDLMTTEEMYRLVQGFGWSSEIAPKLGSARLTC